ncbi:MAG: hypothetical protein ABI771_06810 [Betaproteobacteria bacterium]
MKRLIAAVAMSIALFSNAHAANPEYGGECTLGLSEGRHAVTDCSVLWLGPNEKIYCFATQGAKDKFLEAPKENLSRAQAAWDDPSNLKRLLKRE